MYFIVSDDVLQNLKFREFRQLIRGVEKEINKYERKNILNHYYTDYVLMQFDNMSLDIRRHIYKRVINELNNISGCNYELRVKDFKFLDIQKINLARTKSNYKVVL